MTKAQEAATGTESGTGPAPDLFTAAAFVAATCDSKYRLGPNRSWAVFEIKAMTTGPHRAWHLRGSASYCTRYPATERKYYDDSKAYIVPALALDVLGRAYEARYGECSQCNGSGRIPAGVCGGVVTTRECRCRGQAPEPVPDACHVTTEMRQAFGGNVTWEIVETAFDHIRDLAEQERRARQPVDAGEVETALTWCRGWVGTAPGHYSREIKDVVSVLLSEIDRLRALVPME